MVLLNSFLVYSQDDVLGKEYGLDTVPFAKVMLLPLQKVNYLSDADQKIIQNSELNGKDLVDTLTQELNFHIEAQLIGKYEEVYSIMLDSFPDHVKDRKAILNAVGYKYETPTPLVKERERNYFTRTKFKIKDKIATLKKERSTVTEGELTTEYVNRQKKEQYYNAIPARKEMLRYYSKKYKADLFLFINQLEIKTVYSSQQDRWADKYYREVWVHFSVYDADSEHFYGDVVKVKFNSRSSNFGILVRNTFPEIGRYIETVMP